MDPVFSAVLLGFVLGLQHATDPTTWSHVAD